MQRAGAGGFPKGRREAAAQTAEADSAVGAASAKEALTREATIRQPPSDGVQDACCCRHRARRCAARSLARAGRPGPGGYGSTRRLLWVASRGANTDINPDAPSWLGRERRAFTSSRRRRGLVASFLESGGARWPATSIRHTSASAPARPLTASTDQARRRRTLESTGAWGAAARMSRRRGIRFPR